MCLTIDISKTNDFKAKNKNKKEVTVWKVLTVRNDYIYTPFQRRIVELNCNLVAEGSCSVLEKPLSLINDGDSIFQGVIHVTRTRQAARNITKGYKGIRKIFKCKAKMEDFVAAGRNGYLGFKKVFISDVQSR